MRTLGVYAAANATFAVISPYSQSVLQAYTAGVNAYIAGMNDGTYSRPLEFALLGGYKAEPWAPADSLVWCVVRAARLRVCLCVRPAATASHCAPAGPS